MNRSALLAVLVVIIASGCTVSIRKPMAASVRPEINAEAATAQVIFIRPSRAFGAAIGTHIVDGSTYQLGDAVSGTTFSVDLAPGAHQFCVGNFASSGPMVTALLAAGRTYALRVDIAGGYPYLTPLRDRRDAEKVIKAARGTEFAGINTPGAMKQGDLDLVFGRCAERTAKMNERDLSKFVINPDDSL